MRSVTIVTIATKQIVQAFYGKMPEQSYFDLTGTVVDRTGPLCAYPWEAKYIGSGSIDDAANFVCRRPLDDEDRD